ncbi:MAG: FGGY family carbohydrate kinase [Acidimicrobiales bacterium]
MACVLAVDAGTTGVRTLAFDVAGEVVALAYRPLRQHFPRPGWVEHDPAEIWAHVRDTLCEVATEVAGRGQPVAAIGITNQRETAVAWDRRSGRPLHPAIVWQDRRTAARCEALTAAGHLDLVRTRTGLVLDPYFSATKFEWLLRTGGVEDTPDLAFGTVDTWVLWQLTAGTVFATDVSNASRTMLFDISALGWTAELCALVGVPVHALAEVRPTSGRLGIVSADSGATGGLAGVPISAIAGDQQAALFGQSCVEPGLAKVTHGTGSFVLVHAGSAPPPPAHGLLSTVAWDLGDHGGVAYALEGSTFVAGAAIQWLRDGLGIIDDAAEIGPLAASVPDAGGVVAVPAFTGLGSPWWDPRARGLVMGITTGTGRAQLARAVVEAIAFGVRDMVDAITAARGAPCAELRADGGASAMELLLQLEADQLQMPVVRPRCTESTALGTATLAGLAEGVWGDVRDVAALWQPDVRCEPQASRETADMAYGAWGRAVDRARAWN